MDAEPMPRENAPPNLLYYGDNLDILRRYIKDESVNLIYLDPPFKSGQDYNVLFQEQDGSRSAAQIQAFEDTWQWDEASAAAFRDTVEAGGPVADAMLAFEKFVGHNDLLAYLSMMAPRLIELKRVLKPTGSIYLHCDPTASHYLKMLMDAVLGPKNFRNEVIWRRRRGMSSQVHISNKFGACTDTILFYVKSDAAEFHPQYNPDAPGYKEYVESNFKYVDEQGRRYRSADLANPAPRPNLIYEYKGYKPPANGWAISKEKMEQWDREGRLLFPPTKDGRIRRKSFLSELKGDPVQSLWDDIDPISSQAAERLGYPTQKPQVLLERIIKASSNEEDTILDPFCGCGTAIAAAQKMGRHWIGIDITHLAVTLIKHRLQSTYGVSIRATYKVVGEPVDLEGAKALATQDKYQFQWWALGLVGARPAQTEQKEGRDRGIDGRRYFYTDRSMKGKAEQIIFSVKGGGVSVKDVRDLVGVVNREKAAIGVLISLNPPTKDMRTEAASAEFYTSKELGGQRYPRIQLRTIEELLSGRNVECPPFAQERGDVTFKRAPKAKLPAPTKGKAAKLEDFKRPAPARSP